MPSAQPFVVQIDAVTPAGAADRAGMRPGDRIDVRLLTVYGRVGLLFQPVTSRPVNLVVQRGRRSVPLRVRSSSLYGAEAPLKIANAAFEAVAFFWILACAWLLALRRWQAREGRFLCLALLATIFTLALPTSMALWSGRLGAVQFFVGGAMTCAALFVPFLLATSAGTRSAARAVADAVAMVCVGLLGVGYAIGGVALMWPIVDPVPFAFGWFDYASPAVGIVVLFAIAMGIRSCPFGGRARAAWMLVPIPLALTLSAAAYAQANGPFTGSWADYMLLIMIGNASLVAGAAAVTYALLKRRVLDFQFVVGRALVVAAISSIVVVSFVLLEWALSAFLTRASHATGLAANAALALILGLSMSFIHKRVDTFVDFAFFHKRHEDERALRDFAQEVAFVTRRDDLLDLTIEKIREHTDARSAAVLVEEDGAYRPDRHFGDAPNSCGENDPAILALKATHAPVDPHRYSTALQGDLALPMLARGRLAGVLLLGPRASGEGYAPDEAAALRELAQAVGSALDALGSRPSSMEERLIQMHERVLAELRRLSGAQAPG